MTSKTHIRWGLGWLAKLLGLDETLCSIHKIPMEERSGYAFGNESISWSVCRKCNEEIFAKKHSDKYND